MEKFNLSKIRLYRPSANSHKGQNGKLLVIGGSELFHSSVFWSADVASKIVDLVHLTSPSNENNQIFRKKLKEKFWNGIVVDWEDVEDYIEEDDAILIGPGMIRNELFSVIPAKARFDSARRAGIYTNNLYRSRVTARDDNENRMTMKIAAKNDNTSFIVNYLLKKYPTKKWVIDGGALQEVDVKLITKNCILTPHRKEFEGLLKRSHLSVRQGETLSENLNNCTILLKGPVDIVRQGKKCTEIKGGPPSLASRLQELFVHGSWRATRRAGNPGMTKGGTGDVLAGLAAALYAKNDSWTAAVMASYVNKKAGESLCQRVGPYFNAEDLVKEVPLTIYGIMGKDV